MEEFFQQGLLGVRVRRTKLFQSRVIKYESIVGYEREYYV